MFNVWAIIIQSLNIREWKLLELQITQTGHPKRVADVRMEGRFREKIQVGYKYVKKKSTQQNKTQTRHYLSILDGKMSKSNTPKNYDIFRKCAQNRRCTSSIFEQSLGPQGFWDPGRMAIYFQGAGEHW